MTDLVEPDESIEDMTCVGSFECAIERIDWRCKAEADLQEGDAPWAVHHP